MLASPKTGSPTGNPVTKLVWIKFFNVKSSERSELTFFLMLAAIVANELIRVSCWQHHCEDTTDFIYPNNNWQSPQIIFYYILNKRGIF